MLPKRGTAATCSETEDAGASQRRATSPLSPQSWEWREMVVLSEDAGAALTLHRSCL